MRPSTSESEGNKHGPNAGNLTRFRLRLTGMSVWLELIRNLAVRDIEIRYKHSLLGLYWAIINPLLTAAIFGFVFGVIFHASSGSVPYVVYLLTGLTFWNLSANGITSATGSVSGNASLVAKIYFPRIVLPTAAVLARLIDLAFSVIVLAVAAAIYRTGISLAVLAIPLVLCVQLLLTLGIGYLVAALNVLYRDMSQLVGLMLMIWMYLTPVLYAVAAISRRLSSIVLLNPMGAILDAERSLIFTGHVTDWPYLWGAVAWSVLFFVAGLAVFKRIEPLFAEVL